MPFVPGGPLFSNNPLRGVLERQVEQMQEEALGLGPEMLDYSLETHVNNLVPRYTLDLPVLDMDGARQDVFEGHVPRIWPLQMNARYGGEFVLGTVYNLEIPYSGHRSFFTVNPEQGPINRPNGFERNGLLIIPIAGGADMTAERIGKYFDEQVKMVQDMLTLQHSMTVEFEPELRAAAVKAVAERAAKHNRDIETSVAIKYPLKERPGAPRTYVIPTVRRRALPALERSSSITPTPILAEEHYQHILSVIEQMTRVMEYSPKAFATMREEDIRFHYLVQLNGHYLGNATGETFNLEGKTDISIRDNANVLFVAELKFWEGPKTLTDALDQLLGYITWRETKTALVMFSRNKDFTATVTAAKAEIIKHPNYVSGPTEEGPTRARYTFRHRDDAARIFSLTLLLFNIPEA